MQDRLFCRLNLSCICRQHLLSELVNFSFIGFMGSRCFLEQFFFFQRQGFDCKHGCVESNSQGWLPHDLHITHNHFASRRTELHIDLFHAKTNICQEGFSLLEENSGFFIVKSDWVGNKNQIGFELGVIQADVDAEQIVFTDSTDKCVEEVTLAVINIRYNWGG